MKRLFAPRVIYTALFLFAFVASADFIVVFSSIWEHQGVNLYGSPFASKNLSTADLLWNGLILDLIIWGIFSFCMSGVLLRFWGWSEGRKFLSLFVLIATALTLYNTDIFKDFVSSGWPLVGINYGQINPGAIVFNTFVAISLSGAAYILASGIRQSWVAIPKPRIVLPTLGVLCVLFGSLAIFLPNEGGTPWEIFFQENFVLNDGVVREIINFITLMSAPSAALFLSFIVLLALRDKSLPLSILPLVSSLILIITVPEMKELIERIRPETSFAITADYALPAGHAAVGMIYVFLGFLLYKKNPLLLILFASLAFLSGWIRILLGLHWFGDLLAGWLWGGIVYLSSWLAIYTISNQFGLLKKKWGGRGKGS